MFANMVLSVIYSTPEFSSAAIAIDINPNNNAKLAFMLDLVCFMVNSLC